MARYVDQAEAVRTPAAATLWGKLEDMEAALTMAPEDAEKPARAAVFALDEDCLRAGATRPSRRYVKSTTIGKPR